jgi:hypothetical protein
MSGCCGQACGCAQPLTGKLEEHDAHAEAAVDWLRAFLDEYRVELLALARGRHVLGHFRYGDRLMYEYDRDRLAAEIAEELADAIVYAARRLALLE